MRHRLYKKLLVLVVSLQLLLTDHMRDVPDDEQAATTTVEEAWLDLDFEQVHACIGALYIFTCAKRRIPLELTFNGEELLAIGPSCKHLV